jgi:general secretion pathway protein H
MTTPTSATGTLKNRRQRAKRALVSAGFTLIEIMVVVLIIGLMVGSAVLAIGNKDDDRPLEEERDRLTAMTQYVRERGELQSREYGLRLQPSGYQYVVYEPRAAAWTVDELDESLRARALPTGLSFSLVLEGRDVILEKPKEQSGLKDEVVDLTPQVMLFSNGDTSEFKLTLKRSEPERSVEFKSSPNGTIKVGDILEAGA